MAATIGQRIKSARLAQGLTQHQLAVQFGSGDAMKVSRWERGENVPNLESMVLLADIFDVPVAWFYETEDVAA